MGGRGGALRIGGGGAGGGVGGLPGGAGGGSTASGMTPGTGGGAAGGGTVGSSAGGATGGGVTGSSAGGGPMAGSPGPAGAGGAGIPGAGTAVQHIEPSTTFGQDPNYTHYIRFNDDDDAYNWHEQYNFDWSKWDALDEKDKHGIIAYTNVYYSSINTALRHEDSGEIVALETQIEGARSGLAQFECATDVITYRGSNSHWVANLLKSDEYLATSELKNLDDHAILKDADFLQGCIGKVKRDRGFMSSAVTKSDAWASDVLIKIYVPQGTKGTYVDLISANPTEREYLFNADQEFLIHSITTGFDGEVTEMVIEAIP